MPPTIPIDTILAHIRKEMPKVDTLFMGRLIAKFLCTLNSANTKEVQRLLFTEFPVKPGLAIEIGVGARVKETGRCVATGYDLLIYLCGFLRLENGMYTGGLATIYSPGETDDDVEGIIGFTAFADVPLQIAMQDADIVDSLGGNDDPKGVN